MKWTHKRTVLAALLAGAWLPTTITCDPGALDAVLHVIDDGVVVVEEDCYDCGYDDGGHDFFFDFYHHDDD